LREREKKKKRAQRNERMTAEGGVGRKSDSFIIRERHTYTKKKEK